MHVLKCIVQTIPSPIYPTQSCHLCNASEWPGVEISGPLLENYHVLFDDQPRPGSARPEWLFPNFSAK